jgi:5-methylcytosine-specific restriction endonuclease McrA
MSALNKIPRALKVLIVMVVLAIIVWKLAIGSYFYPGIAVAIILTLLVIYFVYNPTRKTAILGMSKKKNKAKDVQDKETIYSDQKIEYQDGSEESLLRANEATISKNTISKKRYLSVKNEEAKPKATDVAAKYLNMLKTANNASMSNDWESTQTSSEQKVSDSKTKNIELRTNKPIADNIDNILSEDSSEPPMPLIDDETSLTIEEKNQIVNAVWYRCENPYCKYTRFLGVHHIIEEKAGGTNKLDNLIVLCPYCHDLAHKNEIPEKEMRDWISNREDRFKLKPEWPYK